MRKFLIITMAVMAQTPVFAAHNPMFGDSDSNSITINIAQSTGSHNIRKLVWFPDWEISPQTLVMVSYAQPMQILRMPSRMNISVVQNIAYESSKKLSYIGVGASWDIALLQYRGFYFGVGIGPYYLGFVTVEEYGAYSELVCSWPCLVPCGVDERSLCELIGKHYFVSKVVFTIQSVIHDF